MQKTATSTFPVLADRIEIWPLERLTTVERHTRVHSDSQIEQLAVSFDEFGFNNPILTDPNGRIIVGRARYLAARKRNMTHVPVIVLAHLSEAQQRAYRIADNQLALNATWDEEALRLELEALVAAAFSIDLLGFGEQEMRRLMESPELRKGLTDEDSVSEPPANVVSRPGDLWRMDDHRLLCGDATLPASLEQLMGTERAAMCFTDFPYNCNYKAKGRQILNDNLGKDFPTFLEASCRNILEITDGAVYICMSSSELDTLKRAFEASGGHWSTFVIWAKDHFTLGRSDYQRMYEPILYGWKEGVQHHWCGDRNQGDVWCFPKPRVNNLHPTMKPVALIEKAISNSSLSDAIVLDPFAGSGSTLIACQKTGRHARLLELDPQYVDVIVRRWQEFTGREAILDRDGRGFHEIASTKTQEPTEPVAA